MGNSWSSAPMACSPCNGWPSLRRCLVIAPMLVALIGLLPRNFSIAEPMSPARYDPCDLGASFLVLRQGLVLIYGPGSMPSPRRTWQCSGLWRDLTGLSPGRDGPQRGGGPIRPRSGFFFRTALGLQARAVIANRNMAACLGFNTPCSTGYLRLRAVARGTGRRGDVAGSSRLTPSRAGLACARISVNPGGGDSDLSLVPSSCAAASVRVDSLAAAIASPVWGAADGLRCGHHRHPLLPARAHGPEAPRGLMAAPFRHRPAGAGVLCAVPLAIPTWPCRISLSTSHTQSSP